MNICMYCRCDSSDTKSDAHAIPEALQKNDHVLPRGMICDKCNSYFSKLDSALINHKQIALAIQVYALPGKKGKPRAELGWLKRKDPDIPHEVSIEKRGIKKLYVEQDHIEVETKESPGWNHKLFRRSLYYLAFNILALNKSLERIIEPRYDKARKYIRFPEKNESWIYGQVRRSKKLLPDIKFMRVNGPGEIIALRIYHYDFIVDLLNTEGFEKWISRNIQYCKVV